MWCRSNMWVEAVSKRNFFSGSVKCAQNHTLRSRALSKSATCACVYVCMCSRNNKTSIIFQANALAFCYFVFSFERRKKIKSDIFLSNKSWLRISAMVDSSNRNEHISVLSNDREKMWFSRMDKLPIELERRRRFRLIENFVVLDRFFLFLCTSLSLSSSANAFV